MIVFDYERKLGHVKCGNDEMDAIRYHPSFVCSNKASRFCRFSEPVHSAVTPTGLYQPGLTYEIIRRVYELNPFAEVRVTKELESILRPIEVRADSLRRPVNPKYEYRDYQERCVRLALRQGRGVFVQPTSSGKSLVIYGIIDNMTAHRPDIRNTLVLVPSIQLVRQFHSDLIDYGMDPGGVHMYTASSPDEPPGGVIIANRQWLEGHAGGLPDIHMLIVDEAHQLRKTNQVSKFVRDMPTHIRFGLTGTLPEEPVDVWFIKGVIGPVLAKGDVQTLQSRGLVADVNIASVRLYLPDKPRDAKWDYHEEWNYLENHEGSNEIIAGIADKLKGNTLLLFSHIEHGKKLFDMVRKHKKRLIFGETDLDYREDARREMEEETGMVIVANMACFSTGINIKNIHHIVFGSSTKSSIRVCQSIGRGLRMKEGKHKVDIIDIHHAAGYSERHYAKRAEIYSSVYGINNIRTRTLTCRASGPAASLGTQNGSDGGPHGGRLDGSAHKHAVLETRLHDDENGFDEQLSQPDLFETR